MEEIKVVHDGGQHTIYVDGVEKWSDDVVYLGAVMRDMFPDVDVIEEWIDDDDEEVA